MAFFSEWLDNSFLGSKNGGIFQTISNPSGAWDYFKNGRTNEINQQIADENLAYQRERNAIEDARYSDETMYNRDFAENERDYQRAFAAEEQAYNRRFAEENRAYERALQQEVFNREDTALERQASSLSKMGINPLSQQLNGLGSGAVVSQSMPSVASPGSSSIPGMSSRGGSSLHNDFNMQDVGVFQALSPLLSLSSTLDTLKTGEFQRDSLALNNDKLFLDNLRIANSLGIKYRGYLPYASGGKNYRENIYNFYNEDGKNLFDTTEYKRGSFSDYNKRYFENEPDWAKTLSAISDDNIYSSAEKALTKAGSLFEKSLDGLSNESIYDLGKGKNGKFNPFNLLLNLFY